MHAYYDRPMVKRIQAIFDWPEPPSEIIQIQSDNAQEELNALARSRWHEMDSWWPFLADLTEIDSVIIQTDLFDYVFPPLLIRWWEGQVNRMGGPHSSYNWYQALATGCLYSMMDDRRRDAVLDWMVDAYMEGVDAWSGQLSVHYNPNGPDNLHAPLQFFHSIGSSVPIARQILTRLGEVETAGRAQWWLVLITGIAYPANTVPAIPPWDGGGGGIYVNESYHEFCNGYLEVNMEAVTEAFAPDVLIAKLDRIGPLLVRPFESQWLSDLAAHIDADRGRFSRRVNRFLEMLTEHELGGLFPDLG
jgi:hypothetical protein